MFFPQLFPFRPMAHSLMMAAIGVLFLGVSSASAQLKPGVYTACGISWKQKLDFMILPSVEFHEVKLSAALELLRQEATRLDPNSDPAKRGVNILLSPAATLTPEPKITLNMRQIPMSEALRYVASQAGLKVKMEPYAVSLVPLSEPDALVTAEFRVQPAFFNKPTGVGGAKNPLDQGATRAQ